MRLKSRINENQMLFDLSEALFNVINECQPFLKEMKTVTPPQFMYSGRKSRGGWFESDVRTDRKPVDMFPELHNDLNDAFRKKFGWDARKNVVFCTGNLYDADSYGSAYVIFPKGNFKIIWSRDVIDLYMTLQDKSDGNGVKRLNGLLKWFIQSTEYSNQLNHYPWTPEQVKEKAYEEYHQYLKDLTNMYIDDKIMTAINSRNEIMLNCKSYYAINWHSYFEELRIFFKNYNNNYNLSRDEIGRIIANNEEW